MSYAEIESALLLSVRSSQILKRMSTPLKAQLNYLVNSMFAMDILDEEFMVLQRMEDDNPGFLVEIMSIFCDQGEKIVSQLRESVVDFEKVAECVHKFKGSCFGVGAKRVGLGCIRFLKVYEENDREGCIAAMVEIRREFDELHLRLKTMLQLEQQIQALDAKQIN